MGINCHCNNSEVSEGESTSNICTYTLYNTVRDTTIVVAFHSSDNVVTFAVIKHGICIHSLEMQMISDPTSVGDAENNNCVDILQRIKHPT